MDQVVSLHIVILNRKTVEWTVEASHPESCDRSTSGPGLWVSVFSPAAVNQSLRPFSSSERQAPRTRRAGQWSSRTGPRRHRPRSDLGRTWRRARRRAATRSGRCRRSPSGTGRSDRLGWSQRRSLKGWGWSPLLTINWGTDCGWEIKDWLV